MISFDIFLLGLMITSVLTSLVTEAIKIILKEYNISYRSNTLTGIIALILSVAIGVGYIILTGIGFSAQIVVYLAAQAFISWLCSMVGYDKVIQAIDQFKK